MDVVKEDMERVSVTDEQGSGRMRWRQMIHRPIKGAAERSENGLENVLHKYKNTKVSMTTLSL